MRIRSTRSTSALAHVDQANSNQRSTSAGAARLSNDAKITHPIAVTKMPNRISDKAYTEEEDQYILKLKEEEGKDWREIYAAMTSKFPEKNRSQGSIQVRYSRSLKKGASSRPKSCQVGPSDVSSSLADTAPEKTDKGAGLLNAATKVIGASTAGSGHAQGATTLNTTHHSLPQTRSGRVRRATPKPAAPRVRRQTAALGPTKARESAIVSASHLAQAKRSAIESAQLNEGDKVLLNAAMAGISHPVDWDISKQGQPPMPNLKPRSLDASTNKGKGTLGAARKRKRDDGVAGVSTAMETQQYPKSPRQRLIEQMTEKERVEREAKRPKLPVIKVDDKDWIVMHPVELGSYTEDDSRVAWAMKFPGPFRVLERHARIKDHVRLRALRPGELQIGPPNSDVGVWEWVGADIVRLDLHQFENHPYGQNWVLRSTVDDRQRRVGGDYYLFNGTARTIN